MVGLRFVTFSFVERFAICRAKANMNPPVTGPEITGADTQSKSSLTLDARFHGCVPRRSTYDAVLAVRPLVARGTGGRSNR